MWFSSRTESKNGAMQSVQDGQLQIFRELSSVENVKSDFSSLMIAFFVKKPTTTEI